LREQPKKAQATAATRVKASWEAESQVLMQA